jgi:hypothetical protein
MARPWVGEMVGGLLLAKSLELINRHQSGFRWSYTALPDKTQPEIPSPDAGSCVPSPSARLISAKERIFNRGCTPIHTDILAII